MINSEVPNEYLKGFTKFLNCKIDLSKRVFIPRIETEFWVKKAIKEIRNLNLESPEVEKQRASSKRQKPKVSGAGVGGLLILDIFSGSGCIGISILKNIKNSFVDFIDIDKKTIAQIRINLKLNKIPKNRYKIYKSNLFEKLRKKKYDFIFANPPYVAKERLKEVQSSVLKYEPRRAFFAGKKGLYYIKKFLGGVRNFLKGAGVIFLEFDPLQKGKIKNILEKKEYKKFKFFKDQFKKYRFLKIEK